MIGPLMELLFALLVIGGGLFGIGALLIRFTSIGQWAARRIHRFSLDTAMQYECPAGHGIFGPAHVIEIEGVGLCPVCYRDKGKKQRLFRLKKQTTHARF